MLDGLFLSKLIEELKICENKKIDKIAQISKYEFIFKMKKSLKLYININQDSRINLSENDFQSLNTPSNFCLYLRKYLENGIINKISQFELDRIVIINVLKTSDLGQVLNTNLVIELMGRHANIILCDGYFKIIQALKYSSFESKKIILDNHQYEFLSEQLNPLENKVVKPYNYQGFGKNVIKLLDDLTFEEIMEQNTPYLLENDFYFATNKDFVKIFGYYSLLLEYYYNQKTMTERIKEATNNLQKFVSKEIKNLQKKILKYDEDLKKSELYNIYNNYGNLLLCNQHLEVLPKIKIRNFNDEIIMINLDERLSILENANKYFKKSKKLRKSQEHLKRLINEIQEELAYFEVLELHLEHATLESALEIEDDLIKNKYIKPKKRDKKQKIKLQTYIFENTYIYVGLNNLQNEYLTHHFANPNDLFLHVLDMPGSHVIIKGDVSDECLRLAANIAAYYSKAKYSSSVPVSYTEVKNVKKIAKNTKLGLVSLKSYKTIYVDPDFDFITNYLK